MVLRVLGVSLALATLGVGAGYAAGHLSEDAPAEVAAASPLAAESPSYPVDPPAEVEPDPSFPPLQPGLPLREGRFGTEEFPFVVPVPTGWDVTVADLGEWRAYPPGFVDNAYYVRIRSIATGGRTVERATDNRLRDLATASGIEELDVEAETMDSFVASYVSDRHRRVSFEQFFSLRGDGSAQVAVTVVGREVDRAGLADLMGAIGAGVTSGAP